MPRLNVTRVLTDPNFCDTDLQCLRPAPVVGQDGRVQASETIFGFAGVVTSDRGQRLARGATGEHVTDTISVITRFLLRNAAGSNTGADIVQWNGRKYTVISVNDYATYGRGFVEAICELIPLQG